MKSTSISNQLPMPTNTSSDLSRANSDSLRIRYSVCNGSGLPPFIRGFKGPLTQKQILALMSNSEHNAFYFGGENKISSHSVNLTTVYYICDEGKVLDVFTNRRYFRLSCNSPLLEPSASIPNWPKCYRPTHCIGEPAARYTFGP